MVSISLRFSSVVLNFLMVGHTHEDVDQLFGVIVSLILQRFRFHTPDDLARHLDATLRARVAARGEDLQVSRLGTIRDWDSWSQPVRRELFNALASRDGVEAPHSFTFVRRADLTEAQAVLASRCAGADAHPDDVMCVVKSYMRDRSPQQPPVCAIPRGRAAGVAPSPTDHLQVSPLTNKQIEDYLTLAQEFETKYDAPEAARALRVLVSERQYEMPDASWLRAAPDPPPATLFTGNPYFPHLPASSWRLLVRDL